MSGRAGTQWPGFPICASTPVYGQWRLRLRLASADRRDGVAYLNEMQTAQTRGHADRFHSTVGQKVNSQLYFIELPDVATQDHGGNSGKHGAACEPTHLINADVWG